MPLERCVFFDKFIINIYRLIFGGVLIDMLFSRIFGFFEGIFNKKDNVDMYCAEILRKNWKKVVA